MIDTKQNEALKKTPDLYDLECDISGEFSRLETLCRVGARLFDNCGKTTMRENCDGTWILDIMKDRIDDIADKLEDMVGIIAFPATPGGTSSEGAFVAPGVNLKAIRQEESLPAIRETLKRLCNRTYDASYQSHEWDKLIDKALEELQPFMTGKAVLAAGREMRQ